MDMPVLADQAEFIYISSVRSENVVWNIYIYIYILRLTTVWDLQYIDFIPFQKERSTFPPKN